jgi:hypothetical protein
LRLKKFILSFEQTKLNHTMKKRKTDLFRFVTLRTPELISTERKALGFINHPDPANSTFLSIIDESDLILSRTLLSNAATAFSPFLKVQKIKDLNQGVWDFSFWLAKTKNNLVRSELDTKIPTSLPTAAEVLTIWDNLFYDLLTNSNPYIRQACLQVIVGLNFIDNYTTYSPGTTTVPEEIAADAESLKRLANGKVIIHKVFSLEKRQSSSTTIDFNVASKRSLKAQHLANLANCRVSLLDSIHAEIRQYEKTYNSAYTAELNNQRKVYDATNNPILDQYLSSNRKGVITEEQIPDDLIAPFIFSFPEPFSDTYSEGKLSNKSMEFIKENSLEDASFKEVYAQLDTRKADTKVEASKTKRKKTGDILINGVLTKPNTSKVHDYAFSFETDKYDEAPGDYRMYLSIDAGYDDAFIVKHDSLLKIGTQQFTSENECAKIGCSNGHLVFVELFSTSTLTFGGCEELLFQSTIELDNGKQIVIYKKGTSNVLSYNGAALSFVQTSGEVEHYGVNRIGVADYRRVEQELCCYIPGEVSHIENILAKEYKEKSTRSLIRTEDTFESTSEREIEELSDTTSTTRHEMSTEISEVLQKDRSQNFGFDASVSGEFSKFSFDASGYGDFSFAQSSTDSNSQARTYAEDVTRRALERIVQKTTIKRTSKILREFEENNKHGFDNREGTQHVTGVYRWVDKVYKNTIVNYGKRLMYEFMIPEPARWYKEAIIVQAEEEEGTITSGAGAAGAPSIAVKPVSLAENNINSPSDIQRENYQAFAALYGANPEAPMDANVTIPGNGANSPGTGDAEHSYTHDPLIVPPNYICRQISGKVDFHYRAFVQPRAYIKVGIGGQNWSKNNLKDDHNDSLDLTKSGLNLTGNISMSVITKKITNYVLSVELKCELQPSVFQQWQQDVYGEIKRAYEEKLQAFNDAQAQAEQINAIDETEKSEGSSSGRNPLFNGGIVQIEIKRLCIEMLAKPFGFEQGKNFYKTTKCDVPELKLNKSLDIYSSYVKFFEQAFDWELLSKIFYPYYWSDRCDWKTLFQAQDGNDYFFQQFLQSGMGRVVVPVKEGFEDAVTFFMETGKIWLGTGLVIDTDDDLYVSIVDEMTSVEGRIEGEEWETIIPSSLTVVQARSVLLDEGGLPCCETDAEELAALNLDEDTTVLTRETTA